MASGHHRWADSKVYSRKSQKKPPNRKPSDAVTPPPRPSSPPPPPHSLTTPSAASEDDASSLNRPIQALINRSHSIRHQQNHRMSKITLLSQSPQEIRILRRKLAAELELVRDMVRKLEARELQSATGYTVSQLSASDPKKTTLSSEVSLNEAAADEGKKRRDIREAERSDFAGAFEGCRDLLAKLMKHKHGWVFNVPVDVRKLNIPDYHIIIKRPMDLGTISARISENWYKSPGDFAEDVRLVFRNAMVYNPKGQDVHLMAEQLLGVFEEWWPSVEAQCLRVSDDSFAMMKKKKKKTKVDVDVRSLERSDSTVHPVEAKSRGLINVSHGGRAPALKKPKAKDVDKRDMSFEEKQRLSNNLQSLPPEKLENIVQIIKKRNTSLSQHDDEIEVDIDSVDVETLWELDRFVTNYKKSLSKNKRKEKLAILAKSGVENNANERVHEVISGPEAAGEHREGKSVMDEKEMSSGSQIREENKGGHPIRSNGSSSSSSDSGSSSSDSDSESSSAYESDGGQSPRP